jgi:XRE family transcriptional regulator, fatty acid utilization regulator
MTTQLIGTRIRALREDRNLTQDQLSDQLGFKDRQTLSAIETGDRRVSAEELLLAAKVLGAPLETFTDPFLLIGEGRFSWRQTGVPPARLTDYEREAGSWIAAYRVLAAQQGFVPPLDRRALRLTKASSYEDAIAAGDRFAVQYGLGDIPAQCLASVMQESFGILVLMVDAITGVSGAACRLPELDAVLINRQEIVGRRHYDLAHELFHILTWDTMPPDHIETAAETSRNRVEQLANNFASAVLMPRSVLARFGTWTGLAGDALVEKLNETADTLAVTASALKWRLVAIGQLNVVSAKAIDDALLRNNGHSAPTPAKPRSHSRRIINDNGMPVLGLLTSQPSKFWRQDALPRDLPPLFSKPFLEVIARALAEGRLSVRRAAGLLDLAIDDLPELFQAHGIAVQVEV